MRHRRALTVLFAGVALGAPAAARAQDCYANCDGSTAAPAINVLDFACFLNHFAAGDESANCDLSVIPPTLNVNDFLCFLNAFAAGCPDPEPVVNGAKPRTFLQKASKQRIAIVRLGDSNQLRGGHGWDHGYQKGLADRWGLYATPILSHNENQGSGAGIGYRCGAITAGTWVGSPTLPAPYFNELEAFSGNGTTIVHFPSYITGTVSSLLNGGMYMFADWPGNTSANLRYSIWVGRFTTGGGSFRPGWRNDETSQVLHMFGGGPWSTGPDPDESIARVDDDLPAAPRPFQLKAAPAIGGQNDIIGPYLGLYQCVTNLDMTHGGSEHTLVSAGGKSLYDFVTVLNATPDATIARFFRCVGEQMTMAGQPRRCIVMLDTGLNDRNQHHWSLGPNPAPSSTGQGYTSNARALINRLRSVLFADGWTDKELCFVISVSQPQSDDPYSVEEFRLVRFREYSIQMAVRDGDVTFLNLARLTTAAELAALGYYSSSFDRSHLTMPGYEDLAGRELDALR